MFPIALSEEIVPSAVFYGTVAPVVIYFIVKNLIVNPFLNEQKEKYVSLYKPRNEKTNNVVYEQV